MFVKMILKLLCTVFLICMGFFSNYKKLVTEAQEIHENSMNNDQGSLLLNTIQITRTNIYDENFPENLKEKYKLSSENVTFIRKLKIAIKYFDTMINNNDCYEPSLDDNGSKTNFFKVIEFERENAENEEELKLMTSKCELPMLKYEEMFRNYYLFFLEYLKYFPMQFNNQNYTNCYSDSLINVIWVKKLARYYFFYGLKQIELIFTDLIIDELSTLKFCVLSQPKYETLLKNDSILSEVIMSKRFESSRLQ
ncbi:uncharacterized protein LOC122499459 isoform X2 [Leptopilina heterotoma]|uniref:uncharacterized protein LOC122499459 isoform X2 n=1 Tax=Leptopilina heterotoma TaxID=63436 RepID=UPI001CA86BE0|nr:uncharacterized protein LOC122499459 isoform X2 [Leptopilina heterotoma]XP_043463769.1 uncharacterized protein LOC122499459 isoform X2 [Leptopilina heterotoma]